MSPSAVLAAPALGHFFDETAPAPLENSLSGNNVDKVACSYSVLPTPR